MSASLLEIAHSDPAANQNHAIITKRLVTLCGRSGLDRSQEVFGFEQTTVLKVYGRDGARVRPLYLGDAVHFFSDAASAEIPLLQVQLQNAPESEIETVTYAVPANGPMHVFIGETVELDSWNDFVEGAISDPETYDVYADMLPNILFEMSDSTTVGSLALQSAMQTTIHDVSKPLF